MFQKDEPKVTIKKLKEVIPHTPDASNSGNHKTRPLIEAKEPPSRAKFDRTAYQREYMKRWREKRKG